MIEFIKFVGGVVLSAGILASAFAFILKSFARISGSKPTAVTRLPARELSPSLAGPTRSLELTADGETIVTANQEEIAKRRSTTAIL